MAQMNIWPEAPRSVGDDVVHEARIELENGNRWTLWYRFPEEHADKVTSSCDPFVVGTIFLAMERADRVQVHGLVSPSLLRNLEEFQRVRTAWAPNRYHLASIYADVEEEGQGAEGGGALIAFSGGLDSCFSAFRHSRRGELRFPRRIEAGVMIHGNDIPLEQVEAFRNAASKSRSLLQSLKLAFIPVATNFRELPQEWDDCYETAVASSLMLFKNGYSEGLIAQGRTYDMYDGLLVGSGSNALTDPMLSSDTFCIVPDGAAFTKDEKIRTILDWPECLENMRVCWQPGYWDSNCCDCEKCIRNILLYRALGVSRPPCFETDVSDARIKEICGKKELHIGLGYEKIVQLATDRGIKEPWVGILKRNIRNTRWRARLRALYLPLRLLRGALRRCQNALPHNRKSTCVV